MVGEKELKIAYFIPSIGISGGIAVVCQHVNRLLNKGHQVYLVTPMQFGYLDWFPGQQVPIINIHDYPADMDILVATGWTTAFDIVNLQAKKKFYFVQSDETRFFPEGSLQQQLAAMSYLMDFHYLTEARWIQDWLLTHFGHKADLIPNGLDENLFHPAKPIARKEKKTRVLLEGSIALPYKGMEEAFNAVADLDVEVWCVSSNGKPKPEWRCDRFFDHVPMTEMKHIYSSCDILLKLSRVEGFFGPPMEMMACEGAVVVGKVTGYDEYIVDGYNALVVDPQDIPAARAAVTQLMNDSQLKNQLILNGKQTAASWRWDSSIDRLDNCFNLVLSENTPDSMPRQFANHGLAASYLHTINTDGAAQHKTIEPVDIFYEKIRSIDWLKKSAEISYRLFKSAKAKIKRK